MSNADGGAEPFDQMEASTQPSVRLPDHLNDWLEDTLQNLTPLATTAAAGKLYTKMLVANAAAGSIIGKAGANINDVQAKTGARIQLSKAGELFPGTAERVLLVTGHVREIMGALNMLFDKLLREGVAPLTPRSRAAAARTATTSGDVASGAGGGSELIEATTSDAADPAAAAAQNDGAASEDAEASAAPASVSISNADDDASVLEDPDNNLPRSDASGPISPPNLAIKLLVPQPLCGIIIGKGGATVRAYSADTKTQIRVTQHESPSGTSLSHRIVSVTGSVPDALRALALLAIKQAEDPKYHMYGELSSSYASAAAVSGISGGPAGVHGPQYTTMATHAGPYGALAVPYPFATLPVVGPGAAAASRMALSSASRGTTASPFGMGDGAGAAAGTVGGGAPGGGSSAGGVTSVSFPLSEEHVSVLNGKNGGLDELQATAGVHIHIDQQPASDVNGASVRMVRVSGPPEAVNYANFYMAQRLGVGMQPQQAQQQFAQQPNAFYYRQGPPGATMMPSGAFMMAPISQQFYAADGQKKNGL